MKHIKTSLLFLCIGLLMSIFPILTYAQEKIFAGYFDIPFNSGEGTEVTGRIHLERNKDALKSPIPKTYQFEIQKQDENLFRVETRYDSFNRIMGVLSVDKSQNTGNKERPYQLTMILKDGNKLLNTFQVTVKIVEKPLWNTLFDRYKDFTVSTKGSRMYGRTKFSDAEVQEKIAELEQNNGRFKGFNCYTWHPSEYLKTSSKDSLDGKTMGTIEFEWEKVANQIGGLGYSYAKSKKYGPEGNPQDRERLKRALYSAIRAYTACVPIEGKDILVDGKPIGDCVGDGFSNLRLYNMIGEQLATHQWVISDPLVAPSVQLMPDMLEDIREKDPQAIKVKDALIQFYQLTMAEVKNRRAIDDPTERWGEIQDTLYSSGAWADANLGHRLRIMLALPIIWADYNRPMTYVQYWYSDFYHDKPFKNFSFSPGWSPHGVVFDVSRWLTKFNVPAHQYAQSGFHPDGTVSHHTGHGTDAAMHAYGFGWLTESFIGFNQFKNTDFRLGSKYYQFPVDRLLNVYPKLIYKSQFDFLISGRSYLGDMKDFIDKSYLPAIEELMESKSNDTRIENEDQLQRVAQAIKANKYEYSGTTAYWVNEYLVHRRGENEKPFYASVKLKSERTVGAEDFDRVRKSWFAASGVLQLKVDGDEYASQTLSNNDWHMLPGITEEWRTDPLPAKGGSQAALPGLNKIAGVLSDGTSGMAMYHHLPGEKYSSATAIKSYYFIDSKVIALGSAIQRYKKGQQKEIFTCIDQSALKNDLSWSANGKIHTIKPGESVSVSEKVNQPFWVHTGNRGWIVYPINEYNLVVKTGKEINVTDKRIANNDPNYIVAIGHGLNPESTGNNNYFYMALPNVSASEMPALLKKYAGEISTKLTQDSIHAVYSAPHKIAQASFFKAGKVAIGDLTIESNTSAMVMLRENKENWTLSVGDPTADCNKKQIVLHLSARLKEGKYSYTLPGIYPRNGEFVTVKNEGNGSVVTVELPDSRDEAYYNYQAKLYAAAPVVLTIPKN